MRLAGKAVLVTGGGRGIGRGIALRMAREGADVAVADVDFALAQAVSKEIEQVGRRAVPIAVDVSDRGQVKDMVSAAVAGLGGLDIAFNNAGVGHNSLFLDITDELWDRQFEVNAKGVFICVQEEAKQMIRQGRGGKIINTASVAGRHTSPYQVHYAASKWAVIGLTQGAAKALAKYGITVNAMSPGLIDTDMWRTSDGQLATILREESGRVYQKGEVTSEWLQQVPLGRLGTPEDVACLAYFLASPDSDYITGQAINVCGGMTMD